MLEFLFEPLVDTYYFGCPDSCILPNGDTHQFLKMLFTPITAIGVSIGIFVGVLFALGRIPDLETLRSLRSPFKRKSAIKEIMDSPEAVSEHEPKTIKQFERAIRKNDKKEFLKNTKEDLNTDLAFDKFLAFQDPAHPQTEPFVAVRTEAKEVEIAKVQEEKEQEFYKDNKQELEKQARQITELMKSENITEEEAIDRIIAEMPSEDKVVETSVEIPSKEEEEVDMDIDIFKQDELKYNPQKKRKFYQKKEKKQKPKYNYSLTDLGTKRRDEYARQIEIKIHEWALPMPKYNGKNQEYQMEEELLKSEIKKLCLFISMAEMMADKKTSKKHYWNKKIKVV